MYQTPVLSVQGLSKTFTLHILGGKRVDAIKEVSFDLASGQCIAVVGSSGAGKSTLLKCIYRTCVPTSGAIFYRDSKGALEDLVAANEHRMLQLRQEDIRYVTQFLKAQPRLPAVDVVASAHAVNGDLEEVRADARAMLDYLGIRPELQSSYPTVFSGGEQQRVNVARALLRPRRLLLLDEPTSALDAENRERVLELLLASKHNGTAMVAIMHDLCSLERLADTILVLQDGQVAQYGPASEVDAARCVGSD